MLTPSDLELISAAVDGELSADEQGRFRRLVAESADALARYSTLCRNRDRLAGLPRRPAPSGLYTAVMAKVRPTTPVRPVRRRLSWLSFAVAASFLLSVGGGTYLLMVGPRAAQDRQLAQEQQTLPKTDVAPPADTNSRLASGVDVPAMVPVETPTPVRVPDDKPKATVVAAKPQTAEDEKPAPSDVLAAAPIPEPKPFDLVQVKLPLLLPLAELAQDDGRAAVRDQLTGLPVVRIDLFAKDTVRAAELLVATAGMAKTQLTVETVARERMRGKMPSAWAVLSDGHSPDELAGWLAALAAADTAPGGRVFTALHVVPAQPADGRECVTLFGVDPAGRKPRGPGSPKGIAAGTLDQVTAAVAGERAAVLVPYLPPAARVNPALSRDLRSFHERRGERKPGTVAVLLVIRPANG